MVSIMTAFWFELLTAADQVSVKPHASPVLHAINYLLGQLDESTLTTLRAFGGLQSYPSRSKDHDPLDYSTGSVGLGATAPVWGALARRYVEHHFGAGGTGRQYALIGDAELDAAGRDEQSGVSAAAAVARSRAAQAAARLRCGCRRDRRTARRSPHRLAFLAPVHGVPASPSSANPVIWPRCIATTASTPTRSCAPPSIWCPRREHSLVPQRL